jgi:hypothetical protein
VKIPYRKCYPQQKGDISGRTLDDNNVYTRKWLFHIYLQTKAEEKQTKISDLVQIEPADLKKPSAQAIEDNINAKYANKVGLGILSRKPLLIGETRSSKRLVYASVSTTSYGLLKVSSDMELA